MQKVVYSTCSVYTEENEEVATEVMSHVHEFFEYDPVLPTWPHRGRVGFPHTGAFLRTDTDKDLTQGFFVACFKRIKHKPSDVKQETEVNSEALSSQNISELSKSPDDNPEKESSDHENQTKEKKRKKSKKRKKEKTMQLDTCDEVKHKKRKKDKESANIASIDVKSEIAHSANLDVEETRTRKRNKSKNAKSECNDNEEPDILDEGKRDSFKKISKASEKSKGESSFLHIVNSESSTVESKKYSVANMSEEGNFTNSGDEEPTEKKKKKSKKREKMHKENMSKEESSTDSRDGELPETKKKKSKKKKKMQKESSQVVVDKEVISEREKLKKNKKSKINSTPLPED